MKNKSNCGIILFRAQPIHNTHMRLIKEALKENKKVYVVLGSSDKFRTKRNPLTYKKRKQYLGAALVDLATELNGEVDVLKKVNILGLPDYTSENDVDNNVNWGRYLYYNLVSHTGEHNFNLYYCDKPEYILPWFESEVKDHINLRLFNRADWDNGLCATKIREALLDLDSPENIEYLKNHLPPSVYMKVDELSELVKRAYEDNTDGKG